MSESLFEEKPHSSGGSGKIVAVVVAFAVIAAGAVAYFAYQSSKPYEKTQHEVYTEAVRDSTVSLLGQPRFSGPEFTKQILGERGRIEWYSRRENQAYFTYPPSDEPEFETFLGKFIADKAKVEFGKKVGDRTILGDIKLSSSSAEGTRLFRTPMENIKMEPEQQVTIPYNGLDYDVSLNELRNLVNNSQLYGGKLYAQVPNGGNVTTIVFANHGIMVARPEEPSLKRLAERILKDIPQNREARIQRLLDFVSNEIEYSYSEAVGARETLKRPSETLMTRNGDCSNKTILLASLLEQINEEYILLYCPRHITVAVPQGNFVNDNKLDFTWSGKPWMIAESTLAGFQIGSTRVQEARILNKVEYVQDPKVSEIIFDANSFASLKFF